MNFSDYIVYVDESGDHGLSNVNLEFPAFALSFCIIRKDDYINKIVPQIQQLKFDFWGHDKIILREHNIRKEKEEFAVLRVNSDLRKNFHKRLNIIINDTPFTIISAVILKNELKNITETDNPYNIALKFCMIRLSSFIKSKQQNNSKVHIIVESRGINEDKELELEFLKTADFLRKTTDNKFTIKFASKKINSTGLQLADLTARPIALSVMRPGQKNRAYEIIRTKFPTSEGLTVFPESYLKNKQASGKPQSLQADRENPNPKTTEQNPTADRENPNPC